MLLDKDTAQRKIYRMAMQIAEQHFDKENLVLVGIKENGLAIAEAIHQYLTNNFTGALSVISLSLDKRNPGDITLHPDISLKGKTIILIDDVANSGRTMLYAIKRLLNQTPAEIQTLALIERTHKLFPIAVNYVGLSVSTGMQQYIEVQVEAGKYFTAVIKEKK
ncbi:MAG TPA: phosphoribosyltransferase family protein [Ferruginibacter sp.]|nr:phosphoribosyltransferase [Niastella sp.]HRB31045.1 phosphoribosyltransferase family protein [Ferruginibacter sp.]